MIIEINPTIIHLPRLSRLCCVKYPYKLIVANNTAAAINADTILPIENTTKILAKLTPKSAANTCKAKYA
jgi:hypothetical protein